ncbi:hypothetical protein [Streptomyces capitiformicae]|uniref:Uncharacterized protein n=1 Tax=Streptomyces capitiformicae TaxID=2014920 RepID=A0A919GIK2_9ACTN|nr:hypothetical protein [Streptomyces capitiformicae]GHH84615.1 hypothetical protein GCM10017771_14170 [Streptomyces capitiformicae]
MPRKRPGALRAAQQPRHHRPQRWDSPAPDRVHGLSARTSLAIHRYEALSTDYYVFPGVTDHALRRYRAFLRPPGRRPRYPYADGCSCRGCELRDVRHARAMLDAAVRNLPPRARAELGRLVAALDAVYLARTLPDPFADARREWRPHHVWWYRRLEGCQYTASGAV